VRHARDPKPCEECGAKTKFYTHRPGHSAGYRDRSSSRRRSESRDPVIYRSRIAKNQLRGPGNRQHQTLQDGSGASVIHQSQTPPNRPSPVAEPKSRFNAMKKTAMTEVISRRKLTIEEWTGQCRHICKCLDQRHFKDGPTREHCFL
jgi:hypothetical protein